MIGRLVIAATLMSGCARAGSPDAAPAPAPLPVASIAPLPPPQSIETANDATPPPPSAAPSAGPIQLAADAVDASAQVLSGAEFVDQAAVLFRVAACGGAQDIPGRFDPAVVTRHCAELSRAYDDYRTQWVDVAEPFLSSLRPKDLPSIVVYPFGGGDLASALATFPSATEITTISLEPAGDVRPVEHLAPERLAHELAVHRGHLERLFEKAHSRTDNLEKESQTELPGEIVFALGALVVHGDQPESLRYFRIRPDGSLSYVTQSDIDAAAHHPRALRALFDNAELQFRRAGDDKAPLQVLRHIAYNLDDDHLKADPGLIAYLNGKGKVAAMTKAATHLLWNKHFGMLRGWLIEHTDWMVSDSTGLPPRYAQPAGYSQDTYGRFDGPAPFGAPDERDGDDLKRLFEAQPTRDLGFRYGYPDKDGHAHLIVTRR